MENITENKEKFIKIFTENVTREGSKELLEWLEGSTFFTDPSAKAHHGNFDGGLCSHSLKVYYAFKDFVQMYKAQFPEYEVSEESLAIIALLHDLCKVGLYKKGFRNVKVNGQWTQKEVYEYDNKLGMGHGEGSVYIIQTFMKLKRECALAISWHMGAFDTRFVGGDKSSMNIASSQTPLVTLIHMADVWASKFMEETV